MRTLLAAAALAAVLVVPATANGAARLEAPSAANLDGRVAATGSGLKAGRYTLTLVADDRPAAGASCLVRLGRPKTSRAGRVRFNATIPARLRCYQGASGFLGTIKTTPGAYHLVLGVKSGPAAWSGKGSFVRRKLRLRG